MPRPNFLIESSFEGIIAGIDEAGRGPWAGPVVAGAVIIDPQKRPRGIHDSKKLPVEKRVAVYEVIIKKCRWGVGVATVAEIDTHNILQASMIAMERAVEALNILPDIALIDGNYAPKNLKCRAHTIIDGDNKSVSIAAASIIAKVTRDRLMRELAESFPHYGWEKNAGYGTARHQQGLAHYGVSPHHRRSFAPIRTLLEATDLFSISA